MILPKFEKLAKLFGLEAHRSRSTADRQIIRNRFGWRRQQIETLRVRLVRRGKNREYGPATLCAFVFGQRILPFKPSSIAVEHGNGMMCDIAGSPAARLPPVAQRSERGPYKPEVPGSIPGGRISLESFLNASPGRLPASGCASRKAVDIQQSAGNCGNRYRPPRAPQAPSRRHVASVFCGSYGNPCLRSASCRWERP